MTFSTKPYKGTRDFYPEDLKKRDYIFSIWRQTLKAHGFEEYDNSILENAELYIAKSGEELGSKQLYNFFDKSQRHIALRPEMTPSLARIVAEKFGELKLPLRWFSIPNCFRYERPQRGRLREFWQLNVDIIGLEAGPSDLEIIYLASQLMQAFQAKKNSYILKINHRGLLDLWLDQQNLSKSKSEIYKILDNWQKTEITENKSLLGQFIEKDSQIEVFEQLLSNEENPTNQSYLEMGKAEFPELKLILEAIDKGIFKDVQIRVDPTIVRGLAYYTGLVFECFDLNLANPRAMFGGGRYDDLLDLFGKKAPAIGFGWGDVVMSDFLDVWNLWPTNLKDVSKIGLLPKTDLDLLEIYSEYIPKLIESGKVYDLNTDFNRSLNKREKALLKRGCQKIEIIGND